MSVRWTITKREHIIEALATTAVAPPARSGDGATLRLRNSMARFAEPADHLAPRGAVEAAIDTVVAGAVAATAGRLTANLLATGEHDAVAVARTVPVAALAIEMGLATEGDDATALTGDVDRVAAVIGRGAAPDGASDRATERLLARAASCANPVACVSLLYQCLDATAALILTTLDADARSVARRPAVPRTIRVATTPTVTGTVRAAAGDELVLEIGPAGLEFGHGPHACPGRALAEAISAAVVAAVSATHLVDVAGIEVDDDHRPTSMRLRGR